MNQSMPVMQLFPPANPIALALDHDYMALNAVDQFLQNEKVIAMCPILFVTNFQRKFYENLILSI